MSIIIIQPEHETSAVRREVAEFALKLNAHNTVYTGALYSEFLNLEPDAVTVSSNLEYIDIDIHAEHGDENVTDIFARITFTADTATAFAQSILDAVATSTDPANR